MFLKYISKKDAKNIKKPKFQRDLKTRKVKEIKEFLDNSIEWTIQPLIVSNNNIIDGQHRLEAYINSNANFKVPVVFMDNLDKKDFLRINNQIAVPISHKYLLHDKIEELRDVYNITTGSTTLNSISSVLLCSSIKVLKSKSVNKFRYTEVIKILDSIGRVELRNIIDEVIEIRDLFLNNNAKIKQGVFLFVILLKSRGILNKNMLTKNIHRISKLSLRGDLSVVENKLLFLEAYNFRFKKRVQLEQLM